MILVTGGAGFIGANFVLDWLARSDEPVLNLDKLTYAGNSHNLAALHGRADHLFVHGDIGDRPLVAGLLERHKPRAVIHFAAESHVDNSIGAPADFIETNVVGTFRLLEVARAYHAGLAEPQRAQFRFVHVSTDEVYGSLDTGGAPFSENSRYAPNSPYSASKAASDHLARAWHVTYGLPVLISNCSNNYGPYQFPEKLIPLCIERALGGQDLPLYGDGQHVRDWLYVGDHCAALRSVLAAGEPGEVYNIGSGTERTNLEVVQLLCAILDECQPRADGRRYAAQIRFVADRPGHDRRYAVDATKLTRATGWRPAESFETALRKTVQWYLDNRAWVCEAVDASRRQSLRI